MFLCAGLSLSYIVFYERGNVHFQALTLVFDSNTELSISIGTFLNSYDVINRKLYQSEPTPQYKKEQNERKIIY